MNKTELTSAVAKKAGLTQAQAKAAVDAALAVVTESLVAGDKVALVGFGTFSIAEKAARSGFNPRTKEAIEIPARKAIKFKAGAELDSKIK